MPSKIKALWIVCIVIVFFGFLALAVKDGLNKSRELQAAAETQKAKAIEQKALLDKKNPPEKLVIDPIKEIRELNAMGEYDEAINMSRQLAELNPENATVHTWWGISLVKSGKNKEAIEKFIISSKLDDSQARNFLYWGLTLAMEGNYEEAVSKYARAVELEPENSNAYAYWGASLNQLERYPEAIEKIEKSLNINSYNETAYAALVEAYYYLEEFDNAWKAVARARQAKITLPESSLKHLSEKMMEPAAG